MSVESTLELIDNLGFDYAWQIDSAIVEKDGYVQPKKVSISFYDFNDAGQVLDPDSFANIVGDGFVYFKKRSDGLRYDLVTDTNIIPLATEGEFNLYRLNPDETIRDGDLFYFYDESLDYVKYWDAATAALVYTDQYFGRRGRSEIKFHYVHNSGQERRIDPSKSNIIDIYVLTTSYDNEYRSWLSGDISAEPLPPTSQSLEQNYIAKLDAIKAISDEIVFNPVNYKVLFGSKAEPALQATFKASRNSSRPTTDNDLKSRILSAIGEFFALENWEFGQSFFFSELSAYVMNKLSPDITNFVVVPKGNYGFGSYYEIACQSNEIFISGAGISDIEIIDAVTSSQIKASSTIVTTSGT